jgi:hypothetical protein
VEVSMFYTKLGIKVEDDNDKFLAKLRSWKNKGYHLPTYEYGNGAPFLAKLLNYNYSKFSLEIEFWNLIDKEHSTLIKGLNGPHGWIILQVLIIKAKDEGRI